MFATDFSPDSQAAAIQPRRVLVFGQDHPVKHAFAPAIFRHSSGQLLYSCRYDTAGSREGDASNQQALFFSSDGGQSWNLANRGKPILTHASGTGFDQPSSITHSFPYEDRASQTWLYYSVNQPNTWGADDPARSTGGGHLRKIPLAWTGKDWLPDSPSLPVWQMLQPLTDAHGRSFHDLRLVALSPILRLPDGRLLLPVAARSSVPDPQGNHWKLNRSWVLISDDDGASWDRHAFIGGHDSLPLAEPCLAHLPATDEIFCLLRPGYGSSSQMHVSVSNDRGQTWSAPQPAGLPNPPPFGCKPCLACGPDGQFYALLTNERDVPDRTNLALFSTDRVGLLDSAWQRIKIVSTESRAQWAGAAYGSLAFDLNGDVLAAWASFDRHQGYLNFARIPPSLLHTPIAEPHKLNDAQGNHLPVSSRIQNQPSLRFHKSRGGLIANQYGTLARHAQSIEMAWLVLAPPATQEFHLLDLRSRAGSVFSFALLLRSSVNSNLWIRCNQGTITSLHNLAAPPPDLLDTGCPCPIGKPFTLSCQISLQRQVKLRLDNKLLLPQAPLFLQSTDLPDTLTAGGPPREPERCDIHILRLAYGPA